MMLSVTPRSDVNRNLQDRERVRASVVALARRTEAVTGGAMTGSFATGDADEWSDVDLAFAYRPGTDAGSLLAEWTKAIDAQFGVLHSFDLRSGPTYVLRIMLLESGVEVDVGLWPAKEFRARGPAFRLIFGDLTSAAAGCPPADIEQRVGLAWHHVLHADAALRRARPWRTAYYIDGLRAQTMAIACAKRGLPTADARGADRLPKTVAAAFERTLVANLAAGELRRALTELTALFLAEISDSHPTLAEALAALRR